MDATQILNGDNVAVIANSLLSDLKNSYQIWEDLVAKSSKFHSTLKVALQASSALLDVLQKVADMATKNLSGSKEIGACLTRICMRQRGLETKLKAMDNHLVTSLANPLTGKVDEWRRSLSQLEKDRSKHIKRVRAELKKSLSEAQRWEKKAVKSGVNPNSFSFGLEPGVGYGILPSVNPIGMNANLIASQVLKSLSDVEKKKEIVENTEKNSFKLLLLEERNRFCFFVTCLMPVLECQSSMVSELSTLNELVQTMSRAIEKPDQLPEDFDSILLRMSRHDTHLHWTNKTLSIMCMPDHGLNTNSMDKSSAGNLHFCSDNQTSTNLSDTDSDRQHMGFDSKSSSNSNDGRCHSIYDSTNLSICGASSYSDGSGGGGDSTHYYRNNLLSPTHHHPIQLSSRESSLISMDSAHSTEDSNVQILSECVAPTSHVPHLDNVS